MKLIKALFSRVAITSFIILLQIALIAATIIWFSPSAGWAILWLYIINILTFFYIITRDMNPEFKIPWIILVLILPALGAVLYALLHTNRMRKINREEFEKIKSLSVKYIEQDEKIYKELCDIDMRIATQSRYMQTTSATYLYKNTEVKYYPTGEGFFEAMLNDLRLAEKFIFIEFFIISKGKLWDSVLEVLKEKAKKGVEVRVMYDDIGSNKHLPSNYYKVLRKMGIQCQRFNPFKPFLSSIYNNRDHRKIVVVDNKTAYMCGANIADEYANIISPYGYWKDSAVRIRGDAVKNITLMYLQSYDSMTRVEIDYKKYLAIPTEKVYSKGFVQPFGDGPRPAYEDYVAENVYLNIINSAKEYIYITTPYLVIDYTMMSALQNAAKKGIDVRIITPHIPDKKLIFLLTRSSYLPLIKAGVKIYEFEPGFMHSKNIVSDDTTAVVGTINLDYRSLVHHFECGIWMYGVDAVNDIKMDFLRTLDKCIVIDENNCKLSLIQRVFRSLLSLFTPML